MRRKNLASAAMNKLKAMWLSKKRINIDKKIKIYNALVKPVLTYNSSTWGLTKAELNKVDAFHRKHLRTIWKRRKMSNKQVYELSKTNKISEEIKKVTVENVWTRTSARSSNTCTDVDDILFRR